MPYFILGILLLAGLLLSARWFVSADPKTLVKALKWGLIGLIVVIALFFVFTGRLGLALWAIPALLPWFLRLRHAARSAKNFSRMAGGGGGGNASRVTSAFLEMELDHDSGDMDGEVVSGRFQGRRLSDLSLGELTGLYQDYAGRDSESARLLAAFLDRTYPDWREGTTSSSDDVPPSDSGTMDRDEAYRVLGLEPGADAAEIKAAHHRLIASLHPDRGGSAYLAAKINQARDVLLSSL
jgi:hypothetical protein